jgi:murein L,D-transpeptidase YcbB/YkuD
MASALEPAPLAASARAPGEDALRQIIDEGDSAFPDLSTALADRDRIGRLYSAGGYRLLWSNGEKASPAAIVLLQELRNASSRGLDPEDYPGNRLTYLLTDLIDSPHPGVEQWALFDAGLSLAALRFLSDLHYGRIDPASVGHNLTVARQGLDMQSTLVNLAAAANVSGSIDALEPQFTHYALLKHELARYRELAGQDGLTDLPHLPAKSVKPGDTYAGAPQLARLLTALGDMPGGVPRGGQPPGAPPPDESLPPQTLTPPLVDALKHFQYRHGEEPDGILGAETLAELTKPLSFRARQIELTMERWRWLPSELVSAPIIVNIPQFRLFAFESTADSEARMRQMDVIVGKAFEATQTPVFSADMRYLVFRPYWEVPYSIALREIVPAARRNPSYIATHQMELVRGGGDAATVVLNTPENVELVAKGALRVRQKPGPDNSLGLVKFMFPNPYNVYLHSTPAKALFAESRRDFSHGCVRVSDPVGLAEYVLRDSPEWTRGKILAAMNGSATVTVTLKNRIRVFIVYGTALVTENGDAQFFDDIYGHDQRLEAALNSRRPRTVAPTAGTPAAERAAAP